MLNKTAKLKVLLTPSFVFTWRYTGEGCLIYRTMKKHLNKSMVEFVKDKPKPSAVNRYGIVDFYKDAINYANALSQTPRLGHFIPCDENDVPLVEPVDFQFFIQGIGGHIDVTYQEYKQYQQACERVLFEGITQENGLVFLPNKQILHQSKLGKVTFEQILIYNLPLTEAGANFFGL